MDLDAFEKQMRPLIALRSRIEAMLADYETRKAASETAAVITVEAGNVGAEGIAAAIGAPSLDPQQDAPRAAPAQEGAKSEEPSAEA